MGAGDIHYTTKDGREFPVWFRWNGDAGYYVAVVDGIDVEVITRKPTKEDFVRNYNKSIGASPPGQRVHLPDEAAEAGSET